MKNSKIKWSIDAFIPDENVEESACVENGIELSNLNSAGSNSSSNSSISTIDGATYGINSELEYLGKIADYHTDLFDHPILSSLIWFKWKKIKIFFWIFSAIKIFQHLFGIFFIFMKYGGPTQLQQIEEKHPIVIKIFETLFIVGCVLNFVRVGLILFVLSIKVKDQKSRKWK